jgi:hypothetical protein
MRIIRTVLMGGLLRAAVLFAMRPSAGDAKMKKQAIPILLDTDIGTDIDDSFALALILASPELKLCGVTTAGSEPRTRALIVCRFLETAGKRDIPVAAGATPQPAEEIEKQERYVKPGGKRPPPGRS